MQRNMVNLMDLPDGVHSPSTEKEDSKKDVEADAAALSQIEQRLLDTQKQRELFKAKAASVQIVEKKYEELVQKHKALLAQLQQMAVMIEHYKVLVGQLEQEKILLMAENKSLKAQENIARDKAMLYNLLMERSKKLEEENSSLVLENERQQKMYEKCFDEVSSQVVDALLMHKGLQEQCGKLQERVRTLESQNAAFNQMVQHSCCNGVPAPGAAAPQVPVSSACAAPPMLNHMSSSDTRLQQLLPSLSGGGVRKAKLRTQAASPSADSVQSMPAHAARWGLAAGTASVVGEGGSMGSLDFDQFNDSEHFTSGGIPEMSSPPLWMAAGIAGSGIIHDDQQDGLIAPQHCLAPRSVSVDSQLTNVCIETEFPATSGSPRMRRVERHPSSGSLDTGLHSAQGFIKFNGSDVRHLRSASAEALRGARIVRNPAEPVGCASAAATPRLQPKFSHQLPMTVSVHAARRPAMSSDGLQKATSSTVACGGRDTQPEVRTGDDIFSDDADDILAKHKSLIVAGSFEDLFELCNAECAASVIRSGHVQADRVGIEPPPPLPPPRSRSRCSSLSSINSGGDEVEGVNSGAAPPLPPRYSRRQHANVVLRRPSKPLPQEPSLQMHLLGQAPANDDNDRSQSSSTDTESIKQEINVLTSQLAELAKAV